MATKTQEKIAEKLAPSKKDGRNVSITPKKTAREAGGKVITEFFEKNKPAMISVLPRHVSPERMIRIALGAMRATPKLMNASLESLMGSIMACSQLGLEPNTPLGHAYLIPFDRRAKNSQTGAWETIGTEIQVIIGYRGMIDLARRSGQIESIQAHAVREFDSWDFSYGLNERLEHIPAQGDRGEIIAFYALAKLKGGGHQFEWMWREQVDRIRDNSQGYQSAMRYAKKDKDGNIIKAESPWFTHYEEMGRKTAVRRLFKWLPMSVEMATAAELDEAADYNRNQNLESSLSDGGLVIGGQLDISDGIEEGEDE